MALKILAWVADIAHNTESTSTMWCQVSLPIFLCHLLAKSSGSNIFRSGEGLLAIPYIEQHVTRVHLSMNKISEVQRIAFAGATNLGVIICL